MRKKVRVAGITLAAAISRLARCIGKGEFMRGYSRTVGAGILTALLGAFYFLLSPGTAAQGAQAEAELPRAVLRQAPLIQIPGVEVPERSLLHEADSNNPLHWDGDVLYLFNNAGHPWRTSGPDIEHLGKRIYVDLGYQNNKMNLWIEATWKDEDGTLYGAYHYEPDTICFSNSHILTAPRIGWIRSINNGATWEDLGFIISANPCRINCLTKSPWDSGGTGDFVFYLDNKKEYFYFYGTSYDPDFVEQGVFVARLKYTDRDHPAGKVMKWHDGAWSEPGIWGHVTPVFPAERDYHKLDGSMFWGPAIHWNTHLQMYVVVLNHAVDTKLTEDGIYISYNRDIGDPNGWSKPRRILDRQGILKATTIGKATGEMVLVPQGVYYGELRPAADGTVIADTVSSGWYPQVIGTEKGETDKLCGGTCRFFMTGMSRLEITFLKPGEKP
jgi:hypothetical protein